MTRWCDCLHFVKPVSVCKLQTFCYDIFSFLALSFLMLYHMWPLDGLASDIKWSMRKDVRKTDHLIAKKKKMR